MKRLALGLLVLALTGCAGGTDLAGTKLTLKAVNPNVGQAVFHLDCGPAGGDVPDPEAACSALANDPTLVTAPRPYTCIGGLFSWFDVTISGKLDGKPVQQTFSTCWTRQMATLGKLGLPSNLAHHVLRRRHGVVQAGIPLTFPPGTLRPGDLLVCKIPHHRVEIGIPDEVGPIGSVGTSSLTVTGTRHADGSVAARCRLSS